MEYLFACASLIVGHPLVVDRQQFGPRPGVGESPVGHPALHPEGCLDIRLPGLSAIDLALRDAEGLVEPPGLLGEEDTAVIRHQRFGGAVLPNAHVQDDKEGGEILRAGEGASDDGTAIVIQHGDRVDLEVAQAVVEVADIRGPVLVPPPRSEGHRLRFVRRAIGLGQAVEPDG